ncbi:MAG: DEAD/DEAH box helicase, partial [Pedobacter sp.]
MLRIGASRIKLVFSYFFDDEESFLFNNNTKISDNKSLTIPNKTTNLVFGGTINICGKDLSWTIWKGEKDDQDMQMNLTSHIFETARIRIATIDKIHYSLIGKSQDFLKNLTCIVLDEAHYYDGVMGANVSYLLKRIHTVKEAMELPSPNIFLASATLANSLKFASDLTSKKENDIVHI